MGAPGFAYRKHSQEDETLYVLEGEVEFLLGEVEFLLGEDTIPAGAGSCVYVPRFAEHAVYTTPRPKSARLRTLPMLARTNAP